MRNLKPRLGGGATTDLITSSQNSLANSSKIFKPLIASSLALALGVSVGMAYDIGSNTSGQTNGDQCIGNGPCIYISSNSKYSSSNPINLKAGTQANEVIWTNSSWLTNNDAGTIRTNGIILKLGDNGNGWFGIGGNRGTGTFTFTNSTLIGSVKSEQNSSTSNSSPVNFIGNGTYSETITGETNATYFALVGNLSSASVTGVSAKYTLSNGANMKGRIVGSYNASTAGGASLSNNVTFSNTNGSENILWGGIGGASNRQVTEGGITNTPQDGIIQVTFENNAKIIGNGQEINGDKIAIASISEGTASADIYLKGSGTHTIKGTIYSYTNAGNTKNAINISNGTLNFTGNIVIDKKLTSLVSASNQKDIFAFTNSVTGTLVGNTSIDRGQVFVTNTGSGAINYGNSSNTISITMNGGGSGAGVWITDYDSTSSGFSQDANAKTTGKLTLNLQKVSLNALQNNYWKGIGQKFIVDYNIGVATIDSGAENAQSIQWLNKNGNTIVMRFRDMSNADNSTITIGSNGNGNGNGNLYTSGLNGQALFQAHTITAYGNIQSVDGSKIYVWGNQITANGVSVSLADSNGKSETRGKGKAILVSDGANSSIGLNSVSVDGGKAYILLNTNATSTSITGKGGSKTAISLSGSGGYGDASFYITDYDSITSGYNESASGTTSSVTLNASSITFANNSGDNVGQTFVLDAYDGSATFDSYSSGNTGNTSIIRFRNNTLSNSAITIGTQGGIDDGKGNKIFNGNVSTNGANAKTLFQAKTINIHGNMSTSNGTTDLKAFDTLTIAGTLSNNGTVTTNTKTLTIGNNIDTYGRTVIINAQTTNVSGEIFTKNGTLTITGADTTNGANSLTAKAIYGHGDHNGNGVFTLDFAHGGSLTTALIAGNKWDGNGGSSFANNIAINNSTATGNILISVIDTTSANTLKVMGGNFNERTLVNTGANGRIVLDGNVAIFSNTANTKNTLNLKTGANSTAHIIGDIVTFAGTNTISLSASDMSGQTPAIIGNIQTYGGNTNISLQNALWVPSNITIPTGTGNQALLKSYVETYGTGEITTNGGRTTFVSRLQKLTGGTPFEFKVNANGGETNLIMQIDNGSNLHTKASINYGNGVANLVFAKSNNGDSTKIVGGVVNGIASESFDANQTNSSINKFFGLTYKDGVKLALQDKRVAIGNQNNASLLQTYGDLYRDSNGSHVYIESNRDTSNSTDEVRVTGFAIGTISQLDATSTTQTTYNVALSDHSVFAGSIALDSSKSKINLVMNNASKMILVDNLTTINNLTLSGTNTISKSQFAFETLAQTSNTIINLATGGSSSSNVYEREDFRVLVIGENTSVDTGLQGNGSLVFINYVNANADQTNASIGGENIDGKPTTAYADRIVIKNAGDNSIALSGKYYIQTCCSRL